MPPSATPYTLTSQQLDAALATLAKAAETFRPSRVEMFLYRALRVCATTTAIAVLLMFSPFAVVIAILLLPIVMVAGTLTTVLFVANLTLVLKTSRQRRLLKQMGLEDLSHSAWKTDRKRHPVQRVLGASVTVAGVIVIVFAIFWMIATTLGGKTEGSDIVIAALFTAVGGTMLGWRSMERNRQRLDLVADADNLRATLMSLQAGAGAEVVVPAPVLEKVARIEQAQIARERTQAVLASMSAADQGYAVQFAPGVSEQKTSLQVKSRLELAELIDDLTANPHPSAPRAEGTLRARTPDGAAEVDYSVDEQNRRIHILALRAPAGESHAV